MANKVRLVAAVLLLFLVVAVDAVSKMMSFLIDGAFIVGVVAVLWPMLRDNWKSPT